VNRGHGTIGEGRTSGTLPPARRVRGLLALLALASAMPAWAAPAALAAPEWRIDAMATATLAPTEQSTMMVDVRNVGDGTLDGSVTPLTLTGTLPVGLRVVNVLVLPVFGPWDCSNIAPDGQSFTCTSTQSLLPVNGTIDFSVSTFRVTVMADGALGPMLPRFQIRGGGAPARSTVAPLTVTNDPPQFGIAAFDADVTDAAGNPFTRAGGHPYAASTSIDFNTVQNPEQFRGNLWPVEPAKDITVDLPPGFFGDPSSLAQCTVGQLQNGFGVTVRQLCPSSSQVGVAFVRVAGVLLVAGPVPIFNMVPPPDAPARLAFNVSGTVVTVDVTVRTGGDYGLTAKVRNVSEGLGVAGSTLVLWGVPGSPVHDRDRACPEQRPASDGGPLCPTGSPEVAFLRNPTSCPPPGVGLPTTASVDSWFDPTNVKQTTILSHNPVGYPFPRSLWGGDKGTTGCDLVPFDPTFRATPEATAAGRPTGYSFDISLPQTNEPRSISQGDLKKAVVTFPLGVRLSASATAGLSGCAPGQIKLHSNDEPSCPSDSNIGSVTVKVPALRDPLQGSLYLAGPHDNPFDSLIALYIVARGSGVLLKLPGQVSLDPFTGQITTSFDDNPQAPFSNLHLEIMGGDRGALSNPAVCGTYNTHAELTSWSGKTVALDDPFTVTKNGQGQPCPGGKFTPGFNAGTESNAAGSSSPFHVRVTRDDDDEDIQGLSFHLPGGLVGKIADVPVLCGGLDAAAGRCPESSRIASVTTGAGAGPDPFVITDGKAYLTGPYKGAPYGLSIVVPAVAGPFNLGTVVVRSAVRVDKHTAEVTIDSDPLPLILEGVTLGVRDISVVTDRPGFWLNPTNCAEQHITGQVTSASGQRVAVSQRFQAAECRSLPLAPRMALSVGAVGRTSRNASAPLTTTLTLPRGDVNLRSVGVSLPTTINARLPVINRACTRAQFEAGRCEGARAGTAEAKTPLLRNPLRGGVFFVRNGRPLPDLFISLHGDVDFDLIGRVSIPGGKHLATTFDAVPDVPVTSFTLKLVAGDHGPVGAATNLCSRRGRNAKARIDYIGQSGKTKHVEQRLKINGCGKSRHHRRHRSRR
jgi:hypothetical protein